MKDMILVLKRTFYGIPKEMVYLPKEVVIAKRMAITSRKPSFTYGERYKVMNISKGWVMFINDSGLESWFPTVSTSHINFYSYDDCFRKMKEIHA